MREIKRGGKIKKKRDKEKDYQEIKDEENNRSKEVNREVEDLE